MRQKSAKRPRRQAKQERARATVDAILEAAARVLAASGYAAATTNRLAREAGVSIGTLYEYFADRDEVFDALIRREIDALLIAFETVEARAEEPLIPQLAAMIGAGMAAMPHGPALFRALEHVPGAVFRARLDEARDRVVAHVRSMLEVHRQALRVRDLDLAAFVTVTAVEGVAAAASNERFDVGLAGEMLALVEGYLVGGDRSS